MNDLTPRYAVVTGAGSGIGREFSRALAASGWHVAACDIKRDAASEVAGSLKNARAVTLDVASPDAWDEVHAELAHDWPRLDLLVNCAGQLLVGAVVNTPTTEIARLLEVNLLGTIWGCRAMVPWMTTDTRPRCDPAPGVINVASIFASVAPPQFATYAASKAGVIAFSESLRGELAPRGLNVTVAVPGITQTPLFESASYTSASVRSTTLAQAESATVSPEQVARDTLRAARRRRLYAVVGRRARFYWRLKRLLPQRVIDSVGRRAREVYPDS